MNGIIVIFKTMLPIKHNRGVTLLLVIVILSALLSISTGIFNVVFGELMISGEISESYVAFYAADRAIDKFLYLDRSRGRGLSDGAEENTTSLSSSNGCYVVRMIKSDISAQCQVSDPAIACIKSIGSSRCGVSSSRLVKRGFIVVY